MLYRGDAHQYRAAIKRRQHIQRFKGILLLMLSATLMFYAIPCFATSVFDYDDQVAGSTAFSTAINDHAESVPVAAAEAAAPEESPAATEETTPALSAPIMNETVGPAMLSNDAAVDSAKKRAQAMQAVTSTQTTMVTAKAQAPTEPQQPARNYVPAFIALLAAFVCAILGIRMITHSRQMLGRRITAEYGSALRAC